MKRYLGERLGQILGGIAVLCIVNLYFGVLCAKSVYYGDLLYFDAIFFLLGIGYLIFDYQRWLKIPQILEDEIQKNRDKTERLLGRQATEALCRLEQMNKEEINTLQDSLDGLTEYITRWVHEVKLPLSAVKLMNERNQDKELAKDMQDCLERIQKLLDTMLMSSKLKRMENDVRYEKAELKDVVNEALRNQSYFLIQEHFQIYKDLDGIYAYTDRRWLAYILNQLVNNAVKYRCMEPKLEFKGKQVSQDEVVLIVKDNGIGIKEEEIPYIFDRGYIGSNLRNGDYRSTGMGLYFTDEAAKRLGMQIQVSSKQGCGTSFELHFYNNAEYFLM